MAFQQAADLLILLHFGFIFFVVFGCLLVWRWSWLIWLHLPAVAWAILIEFSGGICPLTPWENHFRRLAGQQGYPGSFVEHYLLPIIYPAACAR